uniref:Uncharacterized protein n=1 Tax=Physcomitrium patens TaxID=3218 RepID=A0A2K1K3U2_PHYPA|nr:hypothetical protein PHYPA_012916 [Physcomitrium patens]
MFRFIAYPCTVSKSDLSSYQKSRKTTQLLNFQHKFKVREADLYQQQIYKVYID